MSEKKEVKSKLVIGNVYTRDELYEMSKVLGNYTFSTNYIKVGDCRFDKNLESDYVLTETPESRIEDSSNHPSIHRSESKKFKSYYG